MSSHSRDAGVVNITTLQVGVFVDYVPAWLGPTLLMLGLSVMGGLFRWMAITSSRDDPQIAMSGDPERRMAFILTMVGALFLLVHAYFTNTFLFAGMALLAGRWIEGIAATRFVATVSNFFSDSSSDGSFIVGYAKKRAYRFGGLLLFLFVGGWVIIYGLLFGVGAGQPAVQLAFGWTVLVGAVSLFGLLWKFRELYRLGAASATGRIDAKATSLWLIIVLITALLVAVVGAQLYNFQLLSLQATVEGIESGVSALEIFLPILGNIVYVIEFIVGAKMQW